MTEPVAVVGMACRYPDADSVERLLVNSLAQRRAFRRIPECRLGPEYFDGGNSGADRSYSNQAALLNGFEFNRQWFRVSSRSYDVTDITHWLALTVAREALDDIRFRKGAHPNGDGVRVVVGNSLAGEFSRSSLMRLRWPYVRRVVAEHLRDEDPALEDDDLLRSLDALEARYKHPFPVPNEDFLAGGLANTIAGRICNHFDFKGGGYTVDAACASSLLAVNDGCSALVAGDADMVLVGGVDLSLDPFELIGFSRSEALARHEMLVYDERSEGFWPGEGSGFVALMRLADAVERCERVHGVIHGWGISSDGRGGLTRPESDGQLLALQRCYDRAGYGIGTVGLFEGHGTGTKVGDTAELRALITARQLGGEVREPAVISSVKANIGHTKAAAGIAGLMRAVACVGGHVLPPTTACVRPHALLDEHRDNLTTSDHPRRWSANGVPRRAGVSAMGFGGINTHVTIEEAPVTTRSAVTFLSGDDLAGLRTAQDAELFLLSGWRRDELAWTIDRVAGYAAEVSRSELTDLAVELARRSAGMLRATWKAAVVAASPDELRQRFQVVQRALTTASEGDVVLGVADGVFVSAGAACGRIGFVFPGQGAPARPDGAVHTRRFDEVRRTYCAADLASFTERGDTDFAQPAIVTAALAGIEMLRRVGTEGDVALGHSLGELPALHWAGCVDARELAHLACARGRLTVADARTEGAMAAIAAGLAETTAAIGGRPNVYVANINSPTQTVIAGHREEIEGLVAQLRADGFDATVLGVRRAFHTPAMASVATAYADAMGDVSFRPAERTVVSTVTGLPLEPDTDIGRYLCEQLVAPVRFQQACSAVAADVDLVVEVGPGDVMANLIRTFTTTPVISIDVGGPSLAPYLGAVGAAFVLGRTPNVARLFEDRFARRFDWNWRPRFLQNPCESSSRATRTRIPASVAGDVRQPERRLVLEAQGSTVDRLRHILAEHTGLPTWTLQESSRMSSDLHLNSITVAEVVTHLAISYRLLTPVEPTEYADSRLGEIAVAIDELAASGPVAAPDRPKVPGGVARWVRAFDTVRLPARPLAPGDPHGSGTWEGFGATTESHVRLLQRLNDEPHGTGVITWLAEDPGVADQERLLVSAQRCLQRHHESGGPVRFVVVQHGWGAGGFVRSFVQEHLSIDVLLINLPPGDRPASERWITAEIDAPTTRFREVFIRARGQRDEERIRAVAPASPAATTSVLDSRDVVLVTGGGKGISAECGLELARRSGCALLVIGRTSPLVDVELANNLERLRLAGVRASYQVADVTDAGAVRSAIAAGAADLGSPVTGIVHGAGANHPRAVADLSVGDLADTLSPKLGGLKNVLAAVEPDDLKLLATFSSIIARVGLRGEADYALANEWLSHATEVFQQQHPRCRCRAVEWSVWSGTGMGQRLGRIDALERQGITAITVDDGVAEFIRLADTPDLPTRLIVSGRFGSPPTVTIDVPDRSEHRFIETVLVDYPGVELVADCRLATTSDPYLDDHVLAGERIFPAVMALEAMSEALVTLLGPDVARGGLRFRDVRFRKAIVLPTTGDRSVLVRVVALVGRDGDVSMAIRCASTLFQVNHVEARWTRLGAAGAQKPEPAPELSPSSPTAVASADPVAALYDDVLFQRGSFRRVDTYDIIEARRCSARLASDGATPWFASDLPQELVIGDAGARDAALHALQACIPHHVLVPIAVADVELGALDPREPHRMVAVEVADRGDELVYDLVIFATSGRPVERWHGLVFRVVGRSARIPPAAPQLVGAYFERQLARARSGGEVQVSITPAGHRRPRTDPREHRPDGKPDGREGRFRSAAYSGGWKLTMTAEVPIGCDLQNVVHHEAQRWADLIGEDGLNLAQVVGELTAEALDVSSTRVWTAREAIKKAGASPAAPLVVDPDSRAEWVVFRSGTSAVYSAVVPAGPKGEPGLCVAGAVVHEGD